ncbi:MAG: hypothetical protein ABI679_15235 [Gemmatimonadota bacterium]
MLFLVPLAGLLFVAGPVTGREWLALLGTLGLSVLWLVRSGGIADQVANATAILMTGAFAVLSAADRRSVFTRATWAVMVAVLAVTAWCAIWGIAWTDIELALTRQWWAICRDLADASRLASGGDDPGDFLNRLADAGRPLAQLFPARMVVSGMLGLVLASRWHERIAGRSLGKPADALGNFRFTDHLVWVLIVAVAVLLLPNVHLLQNLADRSPVIDVLLFTVSYWQPAASNILVICAALYAARGVAVLSRFVRPGPAIVLLVIATVFLLPFAFIGLATVGLADTWLNFRRWQTIATP